MNGQSVRLQQNPSTPLGSKQDIEPDPGADAFDAGANGVVV